MQWDLLTFPPCTGFQRQVLLNYLWNGLERGLQTPLISQENNGAVVWLDLRGACKLHKNKRLPWGQSVLLINQLNSAFTVLQWVSSRFGTRHRNWRLPNTTLHLQAAEQPSEGRLGYGNWCVWGARGWKRAGTGCW